jgi:DNA-binding phage protein
MCDIANATGMSRISLYKALSPDGNPELATVVKSIGIVQVPLRCKRPGTPTTRRIMILSIALSSML